MPSHFISRNWSLGGARDTQEHLSTGGVPGTTPDLPTAHTRTTGSHQNLTGGTLMILAGTTTTHDHLREATSPTTKTYPKKGTGTRAEITTDLISIDTTTTGFQVERTTTQPADEVPDPPAVVHPLQTGSTIDPDLPIDSQGESYQQTLIKPDPVSCKL